MNQKIEPESFFQKHFTPTGALTLVTAILTLLSVVGGLYVYADDIEETGVVVETLVIQAGLNTKHTEKTDIHHTGKDLVETFVTKPIFEAYKKSSKELDEQRFEQLFKQLDRVEKKLDN